MTPATPAFENLADLASGQRRVQAHRPWPRVTVEPPVWRYIGRQLAAGK